MLKLKSRQENIPGGFQWLQAETGYQAPSNLSFNSVVDAVVKHRLGNPWISKKHNLATDWESVANEIENANALRMQSNPKFHHFLGAYDGGAPGFFQFPIRQSAQNVVAGARRTVAGVKTLISWIGSSGKTVPKEQAEKRAAVCASCPLNKQGDWKTAFTEEAAREILAVVGIMNDLKLSTSHDAKLGLCSACGCVNKTKVWVPLAHILKEMSPEIKKQLNPDSPKCWILSEAGLVTSEIP